GEIIGKTKRFALDLHPRIFLVVDVDDGEGALVALRIAPPEMADGDILREGRPAHGAQRRHRAGKAGRCLQETSAIERAHLSSSRMSYVCQDWMRLLSSG